MRRVGRVIAALLVVLCGWAGARGQEEIDLGEATRQAAQALVQARAAFEEADFSQTILLVNRLLDQQSLIAPGALPVEDADIQVEALKLRGISFYNVGQVEAAEADFTRILQIRPDYALDSRLVSPKIIAAFIDVRKQTTGLLTVLSEPPGADVFLGEKLLGATPVEEVRVPVGRYQLRVQRPGFDTDQSTVDLVGGKGVTYEAILVRNARSVSIVTIPASARVLVDGEDVGTTHGTPPPGFETALVARGLDPARASAPLVVPYLLAGEHVIRVEKECHTSFEASFTVIVEEGDVPLELEPVVLSESVGSLYVDSLPDGAEVFIDEDARGTTPVQIERLCAGPHTLKVQKPGLGRWWGDVELLAADRRTIRVTLRPTLASLGAVRQFGVENGAADRWDSFLREVVEEQTAYNPVPIELSQGDETSTRWDLYRRLDSGVQAAGVLDEAFRQTIQRDLEADLFLVAVPGAGREADVYLYGIRQGRPDHLRVQAPGGEEVADLVRRLEARTRLTVGWSGLLAVDTAESDFPYVVSLSPLAPPGTSVEPGDLIESVEGRPVVSRREFEAAFADRRPGLPVSVTVARNDRHVEATVVTAESPVFPRPGDRDVLVNKYLADQELLRAASSDGEERALSAIGIGLAYLMAGEPAMALERGLGQASLARPHGINQGTVEYLVGLAYEAQGTSQEDKALEAFRRAAGFEGATLWRDDGPFVAPFAAARLRSGDR